MKIILFLPGLLGWLWTTPLLAQSTGVTLTGQVLDAKSGQPLPFASVYVNSTSRGATANENGIYRLTNVPSGSQELIGSFLGYQTTRQVLRLTGTGPRTVDLRLEPSGQALAAVTVTARHSKAWLRQFRQFSRELLGNQPQARLCRIMNPNVLSFQEENGHLLARAAQPLIIENRALGYRLHYDLLQFNQFRDRMNFAGTSRFEELTPANAREQMQWQTSRQRAYRGSLRHLLASLLAGTHQQAGYTVYRTPLVGAGHDQVLPLVRTAQRQLLGPDQARALFRPGEFPFERRLVTDQPLEVYYNRVYTANSPYRDSPYAYSMLLLPNGMLDVTTNGSIIKSYGLDVRGYLGNERLATLLPVDWVAAEEEFLTALAISAGKAVRPDAGLDSLVALRRRQEGRTAPLVFVQTDKGHYCTGDNLWLSAYVLDAARQLPVAGRTGTLQVELIAPDGRLVQHQWLQLTDGRVAANFRLADTLTGGIYRLRAYTSLDQPVDGPAFERSLLVGNLRQAYSDSLVRRAPLSTGRSARESASSVADSLDVQFLPEGGRWLSGVPGQLGIKALTGNGWGRAVKGRIVDGVGNELTRFSTNAYGIGRVALTPQIGQTYTAILEPIENGTARSVALPAALTEGWSLSADGVSDSARLTVKVWAAGQYAEQPVYVTLQSREQLVYRQKWSLQKGVATFSLPTDALPPGVCRLTLWDKDNQPRAERLVFIPERAGSLRMQVTTGKPRYDSRQTVGVSLRFRDADNYPVSGSWSASVTDADQLPDDTLQPTMRTFLLLTAGLRGRVESPAYYLEPDRLVEVDNLLLTQGWRRLPAPQSADSTGGWSLSGRVIDKRGQPVTGGAVVVQLQQGGQKILRSLRTDGQGKFRLSGLLIVDTVRVVARALEPAGARLRFDAPGLPFDTPALPPTPVTAEPRAYLTWLSSAQSRQAAWPAFYRDSTARQLAEVVVKTAKPAPERPVDVQRASLHGAADGVFVPEHPDQYADVAALLQQIPGMGQLKGRNISSFGDNSPLYLIDGVAADYATVFLNLSVGEISRVELLKNPANTGIYGARSANGVIAIYTKKGPVDPLPGRTSVAMVAAGFAVPREFYVPRYEAPAENRTDRRDVLFWQPLGAIGPDGLGNLAFPLNDTAKRLRIVVQGISNEGVPMSFTWTLPVR